MEGLKSFISRMQEVDSEYRSIRETVVEKLKEAGFVQGAAFKTTMQSFENLDLKNFDVDIEDGRLICSGRLIVKILLPAELRGDRRSSSISDAQGAMYKKLNKMMRSVENVENYITARVRGRFEQAFDRMYMDLAKQTKLDLSDDGGYRDDGSRPFGRVTVPSWKIKLGSMGPVEKASGGSGHSFDSTAGPYAISDTWQYWFDLDVTPGAQTQEEINNLLRFIKMIDNEGTYEKMRAHVEAWANRLVQTQTALLTKEYEADIAASTAARDDSGADQADLFESWKRFLK